METNKLTATDIRKLAKEIKKRKKGTNLSEKCANILQARVSLEVFKRFLGRND